MKDSINRKPSQSAVLLIGILLTVFAVVAYRFLPDRRFTLDPTQAGAVYFLTNSDDATLSKVDWVDQSRVHLKCRFAKEAAGANCGYTYMLAPEDAPALDIMPRRSVRLSPREGAFVPGRCRSRSQSREEGS